MGYGRAITGRAPRRREEKGEERRAK